MFLSPPPWFNYRVSTSSSWQSARTRQSVLNALIRSEREEPILFRQLLTRMSPDNPVPELAFSVHHKISQHDLKLSFEISQTLSRYHFLPSRSWRRAIHEIQNITGCLGIKALLNAPFNLEIGPLSDRIYSEQKPDRFDPTVYEMPHTQSDSDPEDFINVMSPRSRAMADVPEPRENQEFAYQKNYLDILGKALLAAHEEHKVLQKHADLPEYELPTPNLRQWYFNYERKRWMRHRDGERYDRFSHQFSVINNLPLSG